MSWSRAYQRSLELATGPRTCWTDKQTSFCLQWRRITAGVSTDSSAGSRATEVLGQRWTILVVRDLLVAPRRYSDLLAGLPGIPTNVLASRLKELEDDGLVVREARDRVRPVRRLPGDGAGQELQPAFDALARSGLRARDAGSTRGRGRDRRLAGGLPARRRPRGHPAASARPGDLRGQGRRGRSTCDGRPRTRSASSPAGIPPPTWS